MQAPNKLYAPKRVGLNETVTNNELYVRVYSPAARPILTKDRSTNDIVPDTDSELTARTNALDQLKSERPDEQGIAAMISMVQAAQITMLQRQNVIDDAAARAMHRAVDSVQMGTRESKLTVWAMTEALDDRVDAAIPSEIAGAGSLGRTRSETVHTALRLHWRDRTANIASRSLNVRAVLHELAQAHVVTVMGAFADRRAAAPSTLGHFLGGVLGPMESTWKRLLFSIDALDRSPLGAGLLVGEVFSVDRTEAAKLLGFREPIENTIDASGSVEDMVEVLEAIAAQAAVIRRFVNELLIWIRTDPTSFFIDERWESVPEPSHSGHAVSLRLEQLNYDAQHTEVYARGAVDLLRAQPYGPVSVNWDRISQSVNGVMDHAEAILEDAAGAVREALIVNRAYLANRAGRLFSTASDVSTFLMETEQLSPDAAQRIAGLAIARLKESNLEASQITPDYIDSAAVLVIGQELKVEMEPLGRYLAPRRYIERRDVLGSPQADRTRAWLENVSASIQRDDEEIHSRRDRWSQAEAIITSLLAESAESREN